MKSLAELFVILFQIVDFGLTAGHSDEQLRVGGLSGLESPDHGLDVRDSSRCLDLLECVVHLLRRTHLFLHFLSHEVVPELVDVENVTHLELRGVLALVGSRFGNFLVLSLSFNASAD